MSLRSLTFVTIIVFITTEAVSERVPKPVIKIEPTDNPDVVYLRCDYSEPIIWKNSAGETLRGYPIIPKGVSITVQNHRNPEIFYTCTLDNGASNETSDPVYERDLFKDGSKSGLWWIIIVILIIIVVIIASVLFFLHKRKPYFQKFVEDRCPFIKGTMMTGVEENSVSVLLRTENEKEEENNDEMKISASVKEEKP